MGVEDFVKSICFLRVFGFFALYILNIVFSKDYEVRLKLMNESGNEDTVLQIKKSVFYPQLNFAILFFTKD